MTARRNCCVSVASHYVHPDNTGGKATVALSAPIVATIVIFVPGSDLHCAVPSMTRASPHWGQPPWGGSGVSSQDTSGYLGLPVSWLLKSYISYLKSSYLLQFFEIFWGEGSPNSTHRLVYVWLCNSVPKIDYNFPHKRSIVWSRGWPKHIKTDPGSLTLKNKEINLMLKIWVTWSTYRVTNYYCTISQFQQKWEIYSYLFLLIRNRSVSG